MSKGKVRIWVTGRELKTNLVYNVTRKEWVKTVDYVNEKYPLWEMIVIYDNKKTYPLGVDDI